MSFAKLLALLIAELFDALLAGELPGKLLVDAWADDDVPIKLDATDEPAGIALAEALDNPPPDEPAEDDSDAELPPPQAIKDKKNRVLKSLLRVKRMVVPVTDAEVDYAAA